MTKATQATIVEISRLDIERFVLKQAREKFGVNAEIKDIRFEFEIAQRQTTISRLDDGGIGATVRVEMSLAEIPQISAE